MAKSKTLRVLQKSPTGIQGLDEITNGGLPCGRTTLVAGSAGCGKTLLAMQFIVNGIRTYHEPGVFMAFEETAEDLALNMASLGYDLKQMMRRKLLALDYVRVEPREIYETGDYDLEGLFVRLGMMIDEVGAKRVAIDSLDALFSGLPNELILRAELRRLFRWLSDKGVTSIVTGEQGERTLTRHGLEEYVSECVIFLDHRVTNQIATRRLRIVKYRGSGHGTNEYPAMIDSSGINVLPISSLGLNYPVSKERVSSGVPRLDAMLGGKGYFKGSSVLISGTAGAGKSSLAAIFADRVCAAGGRCIYFSFEEAPAQIMRNMESIGIHLGQWVQKGLLHFESSRPTILGMESHLTAMYTLVERFRPAAVVVDPISNLTAIGDQAEVCAMLTRMIDFLKNRGITAVFTSLTEGGAPLEQTELGVSSLMDTWILLRMLESASERDRILYVLKSRGMAHSNQMREFTLSKDGVQLVDVYTGQGGVYTGSARLLQEDRDRAEQLAVAQAELRRQRELEKERVELENQMRSAQARLQSIQDELRAGAAVEKRRLDTAAQQRKDLARVRKAD